MISGIKEHAELIGNNYHENTLYQYNSLQNVLPAQGNNYNYCRSSVLFRNSTQDWPLVNLRGAAIATKASTTSHNTNCVGVTCTRHETREHHSVLVASREVSYNWCSVIGA